ncbi:hypothetical protein [Hoeflea sp. 108]|uniref:hypothetical protein n=1 Tax=Hoeflea sp. 108 TaxID=1116369 RepID=UPI000369AF35|nr:hypothetical protein [Hoeflea sp. 108]
MTNKTVKADLDAKALEAAQRAADDAYMASDENAVNDAVVAGITAYLSALPHAGKVSEEMVEAAVEIASENLEIDGDNEGTFIRADSIENTVRAVLALSSQQAEAVPVTWRYDIQYGPDGEANYAWVYDEHNNLVCTAKTHHAIAIVQRASSPSPADAGEPGIKATVRPLDLSNALKHAFVSGWKACEGGGPVTVAWTSYDPEMNSAYERIRSALGPATSQAKGGADLTDLIRCAEILAGLEDEDRGRAFPSKENCAFARKTLSALRSSSPVGQTAKEGGE